MRCTACEAGLDAFVDGSLPERRRAGIAAHVAACAPCAALLEEIRSVDGILLGLRHDEPAPGFTAAVMSGARAAHAPPRPALRWILATYLVFAWGAIGAFRLFGGRPAGDAFAAFGAAAGTLGALPLALERLVGRLLGASPLAVLRVAGALVAVDAALAAAAVVLLVRRAGAVRGLSKRA